jgi:hypothetical protein
VEATHRVYPRAAEFLADIKKSEERDTVAAGPRKRRCAETTLGPGRSKSYTLLIRSMAAIFTDMGLAK